MTDGFSYEKAAILAWFQKGHKVSPMTNKALSSSALVPNQTLKTIIRQYVDDKQGQEFVEATVDWYMIDFMPAEVLHILFLSVFFSAHFKPHAKCKLHRSDCFHRV